MPAEPVGEVPPVPPTPQVGLGLRVSPFGYGSLDALAEGTVDEEEVLAALRARAGGPVRLARSGRAALALVLDELALSPDDVVTILPTLGTAYVSRCVTDTIAARCRWSLSVEARTRAALVIHEWGLPSRDLSAVRALGVPVIEDCAYAFASRHPDGTPVGLAGDFAIYSFPKFFAVPFGGMAVGALRASDTLLPSGDRFQLLRALAPELRGLHTTIARRRVVWDGLADAFGALGLEPFLARVEGFEPGTFLFRWDEERSVPLPELRRQFEVHDVEGSVYYGSPAAFVPCHQGMGAATIRYLAGIVAGLLQGDRPGSACAAAESAERGSGGALA